LQKIKLSREDLFGGVSQHARPAQCHRNLREEERRLLRERELRVEARKSRMIGRRLYKLWYVCEEEEWVKAEMLNLDLQILADSFETRFNPFTLEKPRVSRPNHFGPMMV
jgi:hypothetical protein